MEFYGESLRTAPKQMDSFDWFNAQITNHRLGTHPKGGYSDSVSKKLWTLEVGEELSWLVNVM